MPANHCVPHTEVAKAKMSAARLGKPAPWKCRPTKEEEGVTLYHCGRCRDFFPKEGFPARKGTMMGIGSNCRKCHSAIAIASRTPEVVRASRRRSEATRRARIAGVAGRVTAADLLALAVILGEDCLKCGSADQPTMDHVVPLAKGGLHFPTNLQPLCRPCNERKQARTADYRSPEQRAAVDARWVVEFKRLTP